MSSNICKVCSNNISRTSQVTVLCEECHGLYHADCCLSDWFSKAQEILCPQCFCKICEKRIIHKDQQSAVCILCIRAFHTECRPREWINSEGNLVCQFCRTSTSTPPGESSTNQECNALNIIDNNIQETPLVHPFVTTPLGQRKRAINSRDSPPLDRPQVKKPQYSATTTDMGDGAKTDSELIKEIHADVQFMKLNLTNRVEILEQKSDGFHTSLTAVTKKQDEMAATLAQMQSLKDTDELVISGIPCIETLSDREAIIKVLDALKLKNLYPFVSRVREWKSKRDARNKSTIQGPPTGDTAMQTDDHTANTSSAPEQAQNTTVSRLPTKSLVVKFTSSSLRDDVIASSPLLKDVTPLQVFGVNSGKKIFIRPLWPKPVHDLWRSAVDYSEEINYARPIVRNLTVFMRETRDSALVPVNSVNNLTNFKPRPKQQE